MSGHVVPEGVPPCPDCGAGGPFVREYAHREGCRGSAALEARTMADAAWFDEHPGEHEMIRPVEPGDFSVAELTTLDLFGDVLVTKIGPGIRARAFLGGANLTPDPERPFSLSARYVLAQLGKVLG